MDYWWWYELEILFKYDIFYIGFYMDQHSKFMEGKYFVMDAWNRTNVVYWWAILFLWSSVSLHSLFLHYNKYINILLYLLYSIVLVHNKFL